MEQYKNSRLASTLNLLLLFGILIAIIYYLSSGANEQSGINMHFLDVGQGDAELIQDTSGNNILIDGGPDSTVVSELDKYIPFYQRRLDAIVLTHPHADHVNGLVDVVEKYQVGHVYLTGVLHTTPEYVKFLQLIKEKNIPTTNIVAGDSIKLSDGASLDVLYPNEIIVGRKVDNLNNTSVVTRLKYGNKSALFLGDLEDEGQSSLLGLYSDLKSDILKVSHHGSKYATSAKLLSRVKPQYAVIEVGEENSFGHPHLTTLSMLSSYGIQTFRTDKDGGVDILLTRNDIKILK